jgi:hypothetical protein
MSISITWGTKEITVPQSYLTSLGGNKYELDVDQFRLDLKALEASEAGMPFADTHSHNTTVELSGVTYARSVEVKNGYTVNFEDGTYQVSCVGANHNLGDVKTVDNVSLLIGNSAGLIQVSSGSGVLPSDIVDIADAVWDEAISEHVVAGSTGEALDNASGGSSPTAIAEAVWDENLSGHNTNGSTGKALGTIKILTLAKA